MRNIRSYTDLQLYQKCPRLFAFSLEYNPLEETEAINTGLFTHEAIFAYFRGTDWSQAIANRANLAITKLDGLEDANKKGKALKVLEAASKRAESLAHRYLEKWAKDWTAPIIEPELRLGKVVAHPDLIAYLKIGDTKFRTIVDFKTSRSPDIRWYNISSQCDVYAYILKEGYQDNIHLIAYDVISDDGIYRHTRPPRLKWGENLFKAIEQLAVLPIHYRPLFAFDCPQKCAFWEACYLMETDAEEACREYLEKYYIRKKE